MGLVLAIAAIFLVGLMMHALLFRRVFAWGERLLLEIPLVRSVRHPKGSVLMID
jgi:uncharacterized membrane protein